MTKQEILDKFDDINFVYNDSSRHNTLSRMLDELLEEQESTIGGWISVKDRLPETGGEYLVVIKGDVYRTVTIRSFTLNLHKLDPYTFYGKKNCKSGWYWDDSEYGYVDDDRVTHWMPLPEPPKEEVKRNETD